MNECEKKCLVGFLSENHLQKWVETKNRGLKIDVILTL